MAKQMSVPGTEDPVIEEIQDAGEALLKIRNSRKKMNAKEREANEALVAAMKKHKRKKHTLADGFVVITEKANLKEPKSEKKPKKADGDDGGEK